MKLEEAYILLKELRQEIIKANEAEDYVKVLRLREARRQLKRKIGIFRTLPFNRK